MNASSVFKDPEFLQSMSEAISSIDPLSAYQDPDPQFLRSRSEATANISDGFTQILTPGSDLVFGGIGDLQILFGRRGNDTLYGMIGDLNSPTPTRIDIMFGDVFDSSPIEEETLRNPLLILQTGPPTVGADVFALGDWQRSYYLNKGNPLDLLTSNIFGVNDYALIFDFNPNQDTIRLHGKPTDYFLLDVENLDAPELGGQISGQAIFSTEQGIPDLVGFILAKPEVSFNLNDSYFQYEEEQPSLPEPLQKTQNIGTSGIDSGFTTTTDAWGNVYVGGMTTGSIVGTNAGSYDAWLTKYDSDGNLIWQKQFGTGNYDAIFNITTDAVGNFYLVGNTYGDLFAPKSSETNDTWLAKYDADGNLIWGQQFGSDVTTGSRDIEVDEQGNVYLSGLTVKVNDRPDLFNFPVQDDAWVTKFNSDGDRQWFTEIGSVAFDETYGVAIDKQGNTYAAGWTYGLIKPTVGVYDIWLTKYNAAGEVSWIQQFGSDGFEFCWDVATDSVGNIYLTGWTTSNLGGTNAGGYDMWLAKFLPDGTQAWARQFGSSGDDGSFLGGLTIDKSDNIFLAGYTDGNLGATNAGGYDAWVASYNTDGDRIWLQQFGTEELDYATDVSVDNFGNLYLTGMTEGSIGDLNQGAVDAWIAKLDSASGELEQFNPDFKEESVKIKGTSTSDRLVGTAKKDEIRGLSGDDRLLAKEGDDILLGGNGNDLLSGGAGNDTLTGNRGSDRIYGGEGSDRFVFNMNSTFVLKQMGVDRLQDFTTAEKIFLSKTTFTALNSSLGEGFSQIEELAMIINGVDAASSSAKIVYNSDNGNLFYNQNGVESGFGTGGLFAILSNSPHLGLENFRLIG
jgi:Ca2+-binding RTX toxin-like protein